MISFIGYSGKGRITGIGNSSVVSQGLEVGEGRATHRNFEGYCPYLVCGAGYMTVCI